MNGLCTERTHSQFLAMNDFERNVRVSFKLSREAAIKLREVALTKSELLCNLGVLAVQLGNESQICISSGALNFDSAAQNGVRKGKAFAGKVDIPHVERARELLGGDVGKIPQVENGGFKTLSNVDRSVRAVDVVVARATADSVRISDSCLPSVNTLNKAPFMKKIPTQESKKLASYTHHTKSYQNTNDITRLSSPPLTKIDIIEDKLPMKPILYNGVIKFNTKDLGQDVEPYRNALYDKPLGKISREDSPCTSNEIQDDLTNVNMDKVSSNNSTTSKAKATTASVSQDAINVIHKIHTNAPSQDFIPKDELKLDGENDKTEIKMDSSTTIRLNSLNEPDMTESIETSVNNDINSNIPTFPGHGISFAQHLINLSKQYRLENERSPTGLSNEKFFASEASRVVRNDHVLRSFTPGNEKQEDFMGFSGHNGMLFDCNYSATVVKSAEELSKEQSEASPTNLDSMSETSADSLFEEARLGSVDEFSLSPSSNENVPISSEDNSRTTSPSPSEIMSSENHHHLQLKHEKHKRKRKYQRHLKGHSGIVCKLCMHPVQKSYSCYSLAQAPREIRHLFDDGSHCVRVCRRCLPYKSPKCEKTAQKKLHKTIENLIQ